MYLIYQLASLIPGYTCKIHVTWTTVVPNLHQHEYGSSSSIAENAEDSHAEEIEETKESEPSLSEYESQDDEPIPPLPQQQSQGLTHFPGLNVVGRGMDEDYIPLDNFGEDEMEFWDEKDPEIRLGCEKKAIENIYGTWDENFHELPSYIMALQQANHGTVVQWLHHPSSTSDFSVFKHAGIKHAMDNLESWKEPHAYHRFCLRHVRSNFMENFNNVSLKRMCWEIRSTTQERKYERLMDELKATNKQAWQYLKEIDKTKWIIMYDRGNHRWGILTTNISESMNNVLRGARMLLIKALIEYTFKR
ncbi:hypothetical protein E3N88_07589 [Mikania micrantha]|uniref:MULE transposase domain-containing protein n=1 Tax=Mikania micrantha TaxID=192012 RepID=A0A5N6PRY6_9ASTR|nr:hypothetical protein E3N88_07589 [Mikania micrantha]